MKLVSLFAGLILLTLVSCKNDSDPCEGTQLPVFGSCVVVPPHGNLTYDNSTGHFTYITSGGGRIVYDDQIKIYHDNYPNFKYELWGGHYDNGVPQITFQHENLNGKHIKDKIGKNRTILFPDGSKITIAALGDTLKVLTMSIYDGENSYRFNFTCNNTLEHSLANECISNLLDQQEPDGETGSFEISPTGLIFFNLYTEDTPGNKIENRYNLGEIFIAEPNRVNDFYDDLRLVHT